MSNSAYTLQRLFYQLQTSNTAVGTNELTKSFGWETRHIFEQQDVQELSRKLMERMEEKMKGTEFEKVLPQMFSGKIKTYISCINVPYESSRVEDFWDVQLNVSGNENLLDSFQDYIQVERLDGENQYFAGDQYKLQDANKGVIFMSFPDVLHLQLKRFEYDIQRDAMMKINDRYEFPEEFDASPYLDKDADRSEPWEYQLHGVLVHSGDLNAGHYYAFLKPEKDGWWYKYDDDRVTRATKREVLEENFGGPFKLPSGQVRPLGHKKTPLMRPNSAYMLVYIRKSRLDKILCPVTVEDTPEHLRKSTTIFRIGPASPVLTILQASGSRKSLPPGRPGERKEKSSISTSASKSSRRKRSDYTAVLTLRTSTRRQIKIRQRPGITASFAPRRHKTWST